MVGSKPKQLNKLTKAVTGVAKAIQEREKAKSTQDKRNKYLEVHYRIGSSMFSLGNMVFIGTVVAQLVPGIEPIRPTLAYAGIAFAFGMYLMGYGLMKGGDKQ